MPFTYTHEQERRLETIIQRPQLLRPDMVTRKLAESATITPEQLALVRFTFSVENFVPDYRLDMESNPAMQEDPIMKRFLDMWSREEGRHAETLGLFLEMVPVDDSAPSRPIPYPELLPQKTVWERLGSRIGNHIYKRTLPRLSRMKRIGAWTRDKVTGVQMSWGEANELTVGPGYSALLRAVPHPALKAIIPPIKRDEGKHADYYGTQAEIRFDDDPLAQYVAYQAMLRFHNPVGVDKTHPVVFGHFADRAVLGDDRSNNVLQRADELVSRRLGREGLEILRIGIEAHAAQYLAWAAQQPGAKVA